MKKSVKIFIVLIVVLVLILVFKSDKVETPKDANNTKEETTIPKVPTESGINFGVDLKVVEDLLIESRWQWVDTVYSDGTEIAPVAPALFSLVFSENGKFSGKTDCNDIMGEYRLKEGEITFQKIASTKKACAGIVQESKFIKMLEDTEGFIFTADGALALTLKYDSGSVIFEPVK